MDVDNQGCKFNALKNLGKFKMSKNTMKNAFK